MTIFKWLSRSSGSEQPILENRSEPLQQSSAASASQNHITFTSFLKN